MKIAIVADWLTTFGGAEHVLAEFRALWPDAPFHTTVANPRTLGPLHDANIRTTKLQSLYRLLGKHQLLLPLMPRAIESIDLTGYNVIVSSSHAVGKGIVPPATAVHVCYCHTPMRYAWEMEDRYLRDFGVPRFLMGSAKRQLTRLRRWDLSTAKRVDVFIANSRETASRIERIYGRSSTVIAPPVHDRFFTTPLVRPDARQTFLAVGRLVPYKRFDLLVECANTRRFPLMIVGKGREDKRLKAMAGPTVTFRHDISDAELPHLYTQTKALLFPTHEDAGIVPREAQACGTPVIAFGKGGALDTIKNGETGLFFNEQSITSLSEAIDQFETMRFDPAKIREHAKQFSAERFRQRIGEIIQEAAKRDKGVRGGK